MKQYLELMRHVRGTGARKADRTGTGTLSLFGQQMRFDLAAGFPLVTTKKRALRARSSTSCCGSCAARPTSAYLREHGVTIWDEWADENGELGPGVRQAMARTGPTPDGRAHRPDLARWCSQLRSNPDSRRIIVSAWNVGELDQMELMPCHAFFQFYVADGRLSCQLYQRSADIFLGVPFNIASYALLTHMLAQQCDLDAGRVRLDGRRLPPVSQSPRAGGRAAARASRCRCRGSTSRAGRPAFSTTSTRTFEIVNYQYHPAIKAPVAV